jgi:hypothetical protein
MSHGQRNGFPRPLISVFGTRSRYFSIQVAPQLSSQGWVDSVPGTYVKPSHFVNECTATDGVFFYPEDGDGSLLRHVGNDLPDYTASHPIKQLSSVVAVRMSSLQAGCGTVLYSERLRRTQIKHRHQAIERYIRGSALRGVHRQGGHCWTVGALWTTLQPCYQPLRRHSEWSIASLCVSHRRL